MTISASLVKELRDKTGAGMMDCKTALTEVKGDIEAAVDWLRKKGLSKAAKKAGRIAAEGLIGVHTAGKAGADRRGQLRDRLRRPQRAVPGHGDARSPRSPPRPKGDLAKLLAMTYPGRKATVEDHVKEMIATIGENMTRAPHGCARGAEGRRGLVRAQPGGRRASARSACWWRLLRRQERRRAVRARPPARHAHRRHQSGGARSRRRLVRDARAREGDPRRQEQGQAAAGAGEDRRERPARATPRTTACCDQTYHPRSVKDRDAGAEGGRGQGRRARSRSPGSCATRWARASRRRRTISPPRSPRRRAAERCCPARCHVRP